MRNLFCVFMAASFVMLLASGCCKKTPGEKTETSLPEKVEIVSAENEYSFIDTDGLVFTDVISYSGPYVEDGSNEYVRNVSSIRVSNRSNKALRYAEFSAQTGAGEMLFICTTLLPGHNVLLLETDRRGFTGAETKSVKKENVLFFDTMPGLHSEIFELSVADKVLTLKNISEKDIPGDISVYFKRVDENGYLGGITYRVRFADLLSGASFSQRSDNFSSSDSEIVFIECKNLPECDSE